jgi:hypothetical protein
MDSRFDFRPMEPDDSPALAELVSSSPSAGPASFAYDYRAGVVEIHRSFAEDLHGIVATAGSSVIGMVLADVRQVQWEGQVCRAAYVSNLRVANSYRRQGVAKQRDTCGKPCVTHSAIRGTAWASPTTRAIGWLTCFGFPSGCPCSRPAMPSEQAWPWIPIDRSIAWRVHRAYTCSGDSLVSTETPPQLTGLQGARTADITSSFVNSLIVTPLCMPTIALVSVPLSIASGYAGLEITRTKGRPSAKPWIWGGATLGGVAGVVLGSLLIFTVSFM